MSKRLAQLDTDSRMKLLELPESGMGYYVVKGHLTDDPTERTYVIAGDYFLVPETTSLFYSMKDLFEGVPFPSEGIVSCAFNVTGLSTVRASVSLPPGYVHALGALPLLGTITLKYPTNFYRFCTTAIDSRFVGGTLIKGTYLTTANDHGYANTGFAAVGRYAHGDPIVGVRAEQPVVHVRDDCIGGAACAG